MKSLSLRNKIVIGVVGLLTAFAIAVMVLFMVTLPQRIDNELQKRGISLAQHLAHMSTDAILTENRIELQAMVIEYARGEADVEYVFIQDEKGNVVANTFGQEFPIELLGANEAAGDQTYNIRHLKTEHGIILDIAVPLLRGEAGTVRLGMSEVPLNEAVSTITKIAVGIIAMVLLLGALVAAAFAFKVTRPLSILTQAAEAVGSGDLEQKVQIQTKDEIGVLSEAFNTMTGNLKNSQDSLVTTNRLLEQEISERERVEEALRKSEHKYRQLVEQASDGIFLTDPGGSIISVNEKGCEMLGYGQEELFGMNMKDIIEPQDLAVNPVEYDKLIMGETIKKERRYVRKNGTVLSVEISAKLIGEETVQIIARDITRRKFIERALVESERFLQTIIDGVAEPIMVIGTDYRIKMMNKIAREHAGGASDSEGSLSCYSISHGSDSPCSGQEHPCPLAQVKKSGETVMVVHEHYEHDEKRIYEILASPLWGPDGSFQGIIETSRDVTERVRYENALKRAEEEWRNTFNSISDLVSVHDKDFRIVKVNTALADYLEMKPDEIVGKYCYEVFHKTDEPWDGCPHVKMFNEKMAVTEEITGGALKMSMLITASPIYDEKGQIIASVHIAKDISARKRMEEELRASLREKEMLVKEVHHRVKNNLAVISSLLKLQARRVEDDKTRNNLVETGNRVRAMSLIHERLYQLGEIKNIDFSDYARSLAVQLFRSYGASERITLDSKVEHSLLDVDTAIPCGLILNELITNALKHAFPGNRKGTVLVTFRSEGEGYVLSVKDTGVGMRDGMSSDNADSLGMQIVSSLTNQLGGTLETVTAGGTEFTVRFPLRLSSNTV